MGFLMTTTAGRSCWGSRDCAGAHLRKMVRLKHATEEGSAQGGGRAGRDRFSVKNIADIAKRSAHAREKVDS
jgi:hypothetical protein